MTALLSNISNSILNSSIIASSIKAASNTIKPKVTSRLGSGSIIITGDYTGFNDATLDLEILGNVGTNLITSDPIFVGSGTGTISDLVVDSGATSEEIEITLSDTGTVTKPAELNFFGVTLRSRAVGALGNAIYISVDDSHIVSTASTYSTIDDISKGTESLDGPQYTWGSLPLMGDGTLNPNTIRFTFGDDPTVYREYSVYENGKTIFKLDRELLNDVKKSTPLNIITGYYVVTISNGVTTETYSNIITLFDFLSKVKSTSNLVEVDGVVIADTTPGGMSVDEFPLRTSAYSLATTCTSSIATSLTAVSVTADCPGQLVEIKCSNNDVVGAEVWGVTAPSEGGSKGDAVSGIAFSSTHFGFTVPKVIPESPSSVGTELKLKKISLAARPDGVETTVKICSDATTCGINAKPMSISCVYTKVPTLDCECDNVTYEGSLSENCLGIKVDASEGGSMDATLKTKLVSLYDWKKTFDRSNTLLMAEQGQARSSAYDLELSQKITDLFHDCILKAYSVPAAVTQWDTDFALMQSDITALSGINAGSIPAVTPLETYDEGDYVTPPPIYYNGHKYLVDDRTGHGPGLNYDPLQATQGILGLAPITDWPIDGGQTIVISHLQPVQYEGGTLFVSHTVGFTDAGPIVGSDLLYNSDYGVIKSSINEFLKRYSSAMDYILAVAGIDPKNEASSQGNECWQSKDDDYYWTVNGLDYLPAYTNTVYHSCIGNTDRSNIKCTQEFAFVIKVNEACIGQLIEGDTVEFEITGEATGNKTYQLGDIFYLPIIAGSNKYLAGGVTGNDTLTWSVRGSTSGVLTPLVFSTTDSLDYNHHDLHFKLHRGTIPFVLNDQFSFSIEGGTFKYRFNSEAWSSSTQIPTTPILLGNGLSAEFKSGTNPSFMATDLFSYTILQPYSPVYTNKPGYRYYEYSGSSFNIVFNYGVTTSIEGFAIGLHQLPSTSVLTLQGLDDTDTVLWTESLTWNKDVIATLFGSKSAYKLKLSAANATGGKLGWIWSGIPLTFTNSPSEVILNKSWKSSNTRFLGSGSGASLTWDGNSSWLYQTEMESLLSTLDYSKVNNSQPLILIPNESFTSDSRLVRFDSESIEFSEWYNFQVEDDSDDSYRIIGSKTLPFVGVTV